jgi:hypothetical protein
MLNNFGQVSLLLVMRGSSFRPNMHVELEDILHIPNDLTLQQLDATMRRFVSFCASYHGTWRVTCLQPFGDSGYFTEQYLQTPLQLEHSCDLLMTSELFLFHSERMSDLLLDDARTVSVCLTHHHLPVLVILVR